MTTRTSIYFLAMVMAFCLVACSDDSDSPAGPQNPGEDTSVIDELTFADYGAAARQVLPPVYTAPAGKDDFDLWHDGQYSLLGKVFGDDEPMSIHRNINDHEQLMAGIEEMLTMIADAGLGELPNGTIPITHEEAGSGTLTVQMVAATEPVPVPEVCQHVFGCTEVVVDYLLRVEGAMDSGDTWATPYLGFSASATEQVIYYWDVNHDETGAPCGSQLFLARKDVASAAFEIAGATFKPDGPGDEGRCNWVYHLTGNDALEFTYNMGWYSESPQFQLFGCVQGCGDKDAEFGLRFHDYSDTSGWDNFDPEHVSEEVFGPVGEDPYAFITEPLRSAGDYIDATMMYHRDDSPLAEIPNPFLTWLE